MANFTKERPHAVGFRADLSSGKGRVYEIRRALGISQAALAARLGCSRQTVERCEQTGAEPRTKAVTANLDVLAREVGIEVKE